MWEDGAHSNSVEGVAFSPDGAYIASGASSSSPRQLTDVDGRLFFVAGDLVRDHELWVSNGTAFGTIFAKEIFGGTGMNFLNPALTARAFLYFAYPAEISGDAVWTALDGFSGATALCSSRRSRSTISS